MPVCATDCTDQLGTLNFGCKPTIYNGEITRIYLAEIGKPISDASDPAAWAARIDNTGVATDYILEFIVTGEKPAPESTEERLAGGFIVSGKKDHTVPFTIHDMTAENYAWAKQNECGGKYLAYYGTEDCLFGGEDDVSDGIEVSIKMDPIVPLSNKEFKSFTGEMKWEGYTPCMIPNVIA